MLYHVCMSEKNPNGESILAQACSGAEDLDREVVIAEISESVRIYLDQNSSDLNFKSAVRMLQSA